VALLAVKALLAPVFVVCASVAARRFGPWVGGVIGGLPVVAGPILLVYALAHGGTFAAHAAAGTLLGLLSLTGFVLIYGRMAGGRVSWRVCVLCGWAGFGLATAVLDRLAVGPLTALGLVAGGFVLALVALPPAPLGERVPTSPPAWDLAVRAAGALLLVLALTTASGYLGPQLSGLLAPFPVITTVLATFTQAQRGPAEAVRLLRGMLTGFCAFALFCFTLAVALPPAGIAPAFVLAVSVALATQTLILWRGRAAGMHVAVAAER
jgi:hypothetical protein